MVREINVGEFILEVKNLKTQFFTYAGTVKAVDEISFSLSNGEMLGIVGESGCGKTVLIRSILKLIPDPPGRIVDGKILFKGNNLINFTEEQLRRIRGNQIAMIFQEPMTALNPVFTIGEQLSEVFRLHQKYNKKDALDKSVDILKLVGISSPEIRIKDYPFQMSGGMRQRVVIAMALACMPNIILADEPSTALDVTIQAQILDLIRELHKELNTSMILITHDLGVIAELVQRVLVMYTGKIVEEASTENLFESPLHPYTEGLKSSIPSLDLEQNKDTGLLKEMSGTVPDLICLPKGCTFSSRCPKVMSICKQEAPQLIEARPDHYVRCWQFNGKRRYC